MTEAPDLPHRLERILERRILRLVPLGGGSVGDVARADLAGGGAVVVKNAPGGGLDVEGWMLDYLSEQSSLPVPRVLHASTDLLVMEHVVHDGRGGAEKHAAHLLAELHGIGAPAFGLARDTVIGGLVQPNAESAHWVPFFRDRRLLHMARRALDAGSLGSPAFARLERVAARLEEWIAEPAAPSLIHGDVWGGNVLVKGGRVAAFVDPAIYYADAEIELAFTTLFTTFDRSFFDHYSELRPLAPGFFEVRRDLYNLYPLLVHAVLFGGGYASSADRIARRLVG